LPRNWSAMMMGMMSLVRVLPPDLYDDVMRDIRNGYISPASSATDHSNHHHEGGGE
jgi:hypothetical protein